MVLVLLLIGWQSKIFKPITKRIVNENQANENYLRHSIKTRSIEWVSGKELLLSTSRQNFIDRGNRLCILSDNCDNVDWKVSHLLQFLWALPQMGRVETPLQGNSIYWEGALDFVSTKWFVKKSSWFLPTLIFHFKESSSEAAHAPRLLGSRLTFLLCIYPFQNLLNRFDLNSPLHRIGEDICTLGGLFMLFNRLLKYGLGTRLL